MSIEDVRDFVSLSDKLATAGQPSEKQIREIFESGFEVIINLGLQDPRYCLSDENALATSFGMAYYQIPVEFSAPTKQDLEKFFAIMDSCQDKKVFVHCAANYRVSCFVSLYAQAHYGWSESEAMDHIRSIWEPDRIWQQFLNSSKTHINN